MRGQSNWTPLGVNYPYTLAFLWEVGEVIPKLQSLLSDLRISAVLWHHMNKYVRGLDNH